MAYLAWWSGGITSAVAIHIAIQMGLPVDIYFFETGAHHPDTYRFMGKCEEWYNKSIHWVHNRKYRDIYDVFKKDKYLNGAGARCTLKLKKEMRWYIERVYNKYHGGWDGQIFGFEFDKKEIKRAKAFTCEYPEAKAIYPLIDKIITKPNAMAILENTGIEPPEMYRKGYHNNNCIGCVKGGMGYWNRIREDFPLQFAKTALIEQELKRTCIKGTSLLDLSHDAGRHDPPITAECGLFCPTEMENHQ